MGNKKQSRRSSLIIKGVIVVLLIFSGMTIYFFTQPKEESFSEVERVNRMEIDYGYRVFPEESLLYEDSNEPITPSQDFYYASIINRVELDIEATVDWDREALNPDDSIIDVELFITGEHWQKELPYDVDFHMEDQDEIFLEAAMDLPVDEATELSEEIMEEIEQRGSGDYNLVVQTTVDINEGEEESEAQILEREAVFQFSSGGMVVEMEEESNYSESVEIEGVQPNNVNLMGVRTDIDTARNTFLPLTLLLFIIGGAVISSEYKKIEENQDEGEGKINKILKKHGNRIIESNSLNKTIVMKDNYPSIPLMSFEDLGKIADEIEKPIIMERKGSREATFYVIDQETIYYYQSV